MTVINMPNKSKGTLHSKQGLSSALKYITDPQKTNNGELVSGQNIIIPSNAYDEMLLTREMAITKFFSKNKTAFILLIVRIQRTTKSC